MKTECKNLFIATMIAIMTVFTANVASAQERVNVTSSKNFKVTVQALNKAIKSKGMMIVATVDHQNMLKMIGANIQGATTVEFGKPDMGKMLFKMHPEAGLEMPGRIFVFEKDGKVIMSYYKSNYVKYDKMMADMDKMMNMMLMEITNAAK